LVLNVDCEDLTSLVDADHAISLSVAGRREDHSVSDALAVDHGATRRLVHEEIAHLGDNKEQTKFRCDLHQNGEVTDGLSVHSDLSVDFELLSAGGRLTDFHNVEAVHTFVLFLLTEGEKTVLE